MYCLSVSNNPLKNKTSKKTKQAKKQNKTKQTKKKKHNKTKQKNKQTNKQKHNNNNITTCIDIMIWKIKYKLYKLNLMQLHESFM